MTNTYAQKHGATVFNLPKTKSCKVIYRHDNDKVNYSTVIATPPSNDALQIALLARKIAMRQVQRVEAM